MPLAIVGLDTLSRRPRVSTRANKPISHCIKSNQIGVSTPCPEGRGSYFCECTLVCHAPRRSAMRIHCTIPLINDRTWFAALIQGQFTPHPSTRNGVAHDPIAILEPTCLIIFAARTNGLICVRISSASPSVPSRAARVGRRHVTGDVSWIG